MSKRNVTAFVIAGLIAWGLASLFYAAFGAGLLEASFWFYCLNAFAVGGAFAFVFHLTTRFTRQPKRRRWVAAAAFAAPGVIGAFVLIGNYGAFPPGADPASLGRYGAFLLVAYLPVAAAAYEGKAARFRASSPAQ